MIIYHCVYICKCRDIELLNNAALIKVFGRNVTDFAFRLFQFVALIELDFDYVQTASRFIFFVGSVATHPSRQAHSSLI